MFPVSQSFIKSIMASSQRDFFLSSSDQDSDSPKTHSSLPAALTYVYLWVILFDHDEDVEHPFDYYQVGLFSDAELNPAWLTGDLDHESRTKKMSFSAYPGKTFSLYGKVEKCKFRIKKIRHRLMGNIKLVTVVKLYQLLNNI